MKKILLALCIVSTISVLSFAQGDARSVIEENNKKMLDAMLREDINAGLAHYSDDAISLPSYGPMVRGKDQIGESWRKDMEKGHKIENMQFNTLEVREEGNVAIEIGTYTMTMKMKEGESFSDQGKYVTVWEKDGNDWKIAIETWNSDNNPWESMKEGKNKETGIE